jgi:hypothetical protein
VGDCLLDRNGAQRYKFLVIGRRNACFVGHRSGGPSRCSGADIEGVLGFLVDGVCVVFGDRVFQRSVGVPVGAGCAPLLADLFLCSYEEAFVQKLLQNDNRKLAVSFSHAFGCVGGALSIGNHSFHSCVHLVCPDGLGVGDTAGSDRFASYLDVLLGVDSSGGLAASLCDRRNDFDFANVNFPLLCSGIPLSPAYGVCVSRLIRCARACSACEDFSKRGGLLANKLMLQGYNESRLGSSFRGFYGRYGDLVCGCKLPLTHVLDDLFHTVGWTVVPVLALTAGGPVCLVSTGGARQVWPVGGGCLLLHGT